VSRPSTPRIPPVARVVELAEQQGPVFGIVRPIHLGATLVHNKAVRSAIQAMSGTFFDPDQLDPRLRELIVLRMAWDTRSQYEWGQHVLAARAVGVPEAEIVAVSRPIGEGAWSQLERVALQMVDDLHADDCVSDETWAELASMVDEHHAIAMVGVACCYRMVAGVLNSLGVQPEDDLPRWPN
jgi:4-carboxymuconolactone decarboxylase